MNEVETRSVEVAAKRYLCGLFQCNWRITFRFENGDAILVNYQDYH